MHRSASPRPGYSGGRSGSLALGSPRLGVRDRAIAQLQGDESPALSFLARRGSEAQNTDSDSDDSLERQVAMANAERELKADAEWKRIQQNTFTRWANEHLKTVDKAIEDLSKDLSDGLKLIALIEVLSGKKMPRHNKRPNFRSQKLENVSIALEFLEREGITLVNIDSTDIVDCKLKLILGLIWTLILHYAISMPMWDGPPLGGLAEEKTPKQRLMDWVKDKAPGVKNFTTDWNDGKAIGALVDNVAPGLCPDWEDMDPNKPLENAKEAMDLADKWLNVPKVLSPEDLINPNVDEQSMMTYLSQFPNAQLQPGAPLRKKTNAGKVKAYGPGLEPKGLVAKAPANFTVETFGAGDGELACKVIQVATQKELECEIVFNNDRKATYSCSYFPEEEGDYVVTITWSGREIPKSPFEVNVEGFAGDASKVTASGPGLLPEGVIINRPTYFDIFAKDAGRGKPEVIILDPKGKKDSVPIQISVPNPETEPETYRCEYVATMLGLHSVNVFFAGNPIPDSPYGVRVSPASIPTKVWANGRGLQPSGIRVNETVDFKVYTEGAGEGRVGVKIIGPGGIDLDYMSRAIDNGTTEFTYTPKREGRHIIMITFANVEIPRSPFEVMIGKHKTSKIKAYGPGLKGGIVNKPAKFTVDTCGETGALGFSIQGPSQAKINCKDNGDGSADVEYIPTAEGEYAVHILCDKEDIPGSPYMAQIIPPASDYDPDLVKVFGPGVENGVNPKEETVFTVDITDAGDAPLDIYLVDDLGQFEPRIQPISETVFECFYTPRAKQMKQTVFVNFGGVAVPGSPFRVLNDNPNEPSLVEVYGPGVEPGVRVGAPVEFTVDCSKSGPGDVTVNITSAKRLTVPVSIIDNGDDTYTVTYEAQVPGPQSIVIALDESEVPQSPIKLDIKPAADLNKIKLVDFEPEAFVDCPNDFLVDVGDLPANSKAELQCEITGPDGAPVEADVSRVGDGEDGPNGGGAFQVSYIPTDEGDHDVDLRYDGTPLPDSPFPVAAIRGCNPQKVKAYGDGLEKGICDEPNLFTIETRNAGTGGLGIAVEGPSEAEMNCMDNKDGTCSVEYVPVEEGDYDIAIKFDDEHIPGSPFQVPVTTKDGKPKADARKVKAFGPGLEPDNILPGKPTSFIVDASETGDAPLEVVIGDGSSAEEDNYDNDDDDDTGSSRRSSGILGESPDSASRKGSSGLGLDGSRKPSSGLGGSRPGHGAAGDSDDSSANNDSPRRGSRGGNNRNKIPDIDEDEDGYGVADGKSQGKGLAALRARGDSLSRRGSEEDMIHGGGRGGDPSDGSSSRKGSGQLRGSALGDALSDALKKDSRLAGSRKGSSQLAGSDLDPASSRKGSSSLGQGRPTVSRKNTFSKPVITDKGDGTHEVSYVPPPVGDPYEIAVRYAGVDIPGSPFLMTSNPNLDDVVNAAIGIDGLGGSSRKGSNTALSPERSYSKNGTGLQRGSIAEDGKGPRGVSDLIRKASMDDISGDDDDDVFNAHDGSRRASGLGSKYNRSGSDDPSRRKGSGGSLGDSGASRKSSSDSSGSRKNSDNNNMTPYGRNLGSRHGSQDLLHDGSRRPSGLEGRRNSGHDDLSQAGHGGGDGTGAAGEGGLGSSSNSRKSSKLGSGSSDQDSSRKGSRLGKSGSRDDLLNDGRKSSRDDHYPSGRKGSQEDAPGSRKSSSGFDNNDPSKRNSDGSSRRSSGLGSQRNSLDDLGDDNSADRKGSKSDGKGRKTSLDNDDDREGRKSSKDNNLSGRKGSQGESGPGSRKGSNDDILGRKNSKDGNANASDLHGRKGSKFGSDPSNRRGSRDDLNEDETGYDPNDPNNSRKGSGYDPNDPNSSRKGSGYDPNDPNNSRKGSGYDPNDPNNSRKGSKYDPNDPNSSRKGSGYDPNDPNNSRKGSKYDPNDPNNGRKGSFGLDASDAEGRKSSRGGRDNADLSGRRGSKDRYGRGGDDDDDDFDPNDPDGKASRFGRKGSKDDLNDNNNSRKGSAYDSNDPNGRKGSKFAKEDSNDPNNSLNDDISAGRKGSRSDGMGRKTSQDDNEGDGRKSSKDNLSGRKGSQGSESGPGSRKGSADYDNDPSNHNNYGRKGSNDDILGRKTSKDGNGSASDLHGRKGSKFGTDPSNRRGSRDDLNEDGPGYDPNDPNNSRKGSAYDPNDPHSRKGSKFGKDGSLGKHGSRDDLNDDDDDGPLGRSRSGSKLDSNDPHNRKGSTYDPNDPHGRRGSRLAGGDSDPLGRHGSRDNDDEDGPLARSRSGSKLDSNDPYNRKGSAYDPNNPHGRKGSNFDQDDSDPLGRRGSRDDLNDDDDDPLSRSRNGSRLDPNDPNYSRKGSAYDSNDPQGRFGRSGSKLDPNDSDYRRGSGYDPNDPNGSRKGSKYDSNDPYGRRGSKLSQDDSNPLNRHRSRDNLNDDDDPLGRARSGSRFDPNNSNNSRKGSRFGLDDSDTEYDANDPRRGSRFGKSGSKDDLSDDPYGRSGRKGSGYDPNDPNARKGSATDSLGRHGSRDGLNDDPFGRSRSGSKFNPNDPNYRKGSAYDPNDPEGRFGRRGSNDDDLNDPFGRCRSGSKLDPNDPNYRKGSAYDPNDPEGRFGRRGSNDDLNDPFGRSRSGSKLDPNDPNYRKGSAYDPNDPEGRFGRRGSNDDLNDPFGRSRSGSKLDPNDPNYRKGSAYDPNYPEGRFGRSGSKDDLNDNDPFGRSRSGSKFDPNDPNNRKGSAYDPNDPEGKFGRSGSKDDLNDNDPFGRSRSGSKNPNDLNIRKGSGYDPNDAEGRFGRGGSKDDGLDDTIGRSRSGSKLDPNDPNYRKGSAYDSTDPQGRSGRNGSNNDLSNDNDAFGRSRSGSKFDPNDPHNRKGSGYDANDPKSSRKGSGYDPNDPNSSRKSSGYDPSDPDSSRKSSGYDPNDPNSSRKGSGYDPNGRKGSGLSEDNTDPLGRRGSKDRYGRGTDDDENFGRKNSKDRYGADLNDPNNGSRIGRNGSRDDLNDDDTNNAFGRSRSGSKLDPNDPFNRKGSSFDPNDPNSSSSRKGSGYDPNDPYGRKGSRLGQDDTDPMGTRRGSKDKYGPDGGYDGKNGSSRSPNAENYDPNDPSSLRKNTYDIPGRGGKSNDPSSDSRKGSTRFGDDLSGSRKNTRDVDADYNNLGSNRKDSKDSRHRKGGHRAPGDRYGQECCTSSDDSDLENYSRRGSRNGGPGRKGTSDSKNSRKGSSKIGGQGGRSGGDGYHPGGIGAAGADPRFHPVELHHIPLPSTGGDVTAQVKTPSNAMHLPHVEDNGNGSVGVFYQPTEAGPHNLDVRNNGEHVQGSPYKFYVSPNDEGKVYAYGPGLTHGVCGDSSNFVISTKGAGAGGLALAVEGPSKADINCIDNKDGTVNVSYLPTAPGEYKISARFAGDHIEGSPFTCKVTGEGKKRNAISVGSASELSLPENISDYDLRSLNAYIVSPSGCEEPCFLKKLPKGNTGISFTPREVGEHLVSVKRNGKHITNSPFKIMVNPDDVGDASRVKVSGPALNEGKTHQDNPFTVDTKNAGYGGLSLSIEGPSKAEIKCKDNEDGTLDVSYKPSEPGLYIVNLKFADQHVPGSPFAVAVSGQGIIKQTEKIDRMREAVPVTEVGSQCRLTFKMPGIKSSDLKASVTSPTGKVENAMVVELEDGLYAVNFVPYELGVHTVSVMYREVDIPGSPFQFTVGPLQDGGAHRVHAGGPGLERGIQGQPSDFNVWTREAGHGSLAIAVEGPSKAEVEFKDRKDGSCHVSYVVEEPGEYSVGIRFNDQHIPGSPYKVYIMPSADDAERVRMSNMADGPVAMDIPQTMILNMNGADGDVECKIVAPSGREDDCFITPLGNGEHTVRFVPKEEGIHHLHAKLNGIHIPGSPFKLEVQANNNQQLSDDPSSVAVRGSGIDRGTTGKSSKFVIDTSGVGAGTLSITVDGPSKVDLSCNEVDDGYEVSYMPMAPGKYYVTVKYNGKNVRGSPFSVMVGGDNLVSSSTSTAATINNNRSAINNNNNNSSLQKEQSRSSMTMETMQRTSYIRHQYSEQRVSSMNVTRNQSRNQLLSPPPKPESDPAKVKVRGKGLEQALISRQNSFQVDCNRAGNNVLYVGVYGPDIPCDEVVIKHQGDKKYMVSYVVHEKGEYIIFVKWGDEHIPGSPFRVVA